MKRTPLRRKTPMRRTSFKPTHKLGYDVGVWIPVEIVGSLLRDKEGKTYPLTPHTMLREMPNCPHHLRSPIIFERQPLPISQQPKSPFAAPGKRMRPASPKRSKQRREYEPLRDDFLKKHTHCEAGVCGASPTELHHKRGRIGRLLCDSRFWIALCSPCHRLAHEHPASARKAGLLAPAHEWNVFPKTTNGESNVY